MAVIGMVMVSSGMIYAAYDFAEDGAGSSLRGFLISIILIKKIIPAISPKVMPHIAWSGDSGSPLDERIKYMRYTLDIRIICSKSCDSAGISAFFCP